MRCYGTTTSTARRGNTAVPSGSPSPSRRVTRATSARPRIARAFEARMAEIQARRGHFAAALARYETAIPRFDAAFRASPEDVNAKYDLAVALAGRAFSQRHSPPRRVPGSPGRKRAPPTRQASSSGGRSTATRRVTSGSRPALPARTSRPREMASPAVRSRCAVSRVDSLSRPSRDRCPSPRRPRHHDRDRAGPRS
jgi:hypothetical protein